MWSFKSTSLDKDVQKITLHNGRAQLTFRDVIGLWKGNSGFRDLYCSILEESPFEAFFWENPPMTSATLRRPYEFVLIDSPQLARIAADSSPFQDRFNPPSSEQTIVTIGNLRRDAELIVPSPIGPHRIYTHFASFVRNAPERQKHKLFISLANRLDERISNRPIWVSTSGLGVYWLHIRLDSRPKYYFHQPYCQLD